jgi:Holliday junction resolvasome RuvABC ATP-dependent DNA helicase subunit
MFTQIIGQSAHKLAASNMIKAVRNGSPLPCVAVTGERGAGKTTFLKAILQELNPDVILPVVKKDRLPKPSDVRGQNRDYVRYEEFIESLLVTLSGRKSAAIVFDEFHELPYGPNINPLTYKLLFDLLMELTILAKEGRSAKIQIGESFVTFDPHRHFVLVASNYPDMINPALLSRFRLMALSSYSPEDLHKICLAKLEECKLKVHNVEVVRPMVNLCRTSARDVDTLVGELQIVCGAKNKKTINLEDVKTAIKQLGLYPFGFVRDFVLALEMIEKRSYSGRFIEYVNPSLNGTVRNEMAIARKAGLVDENGKGWYLTKHGKDSLNTWKKDGFRW